MKYAYISFNLWQQLEVPLLKAVLFERKEKNTFGLIINKSISTSEYYEDLLFQLIDGKYAISYVDETDKYKNNIFEFNYPFENIKEYMNKLTDLPVKVSYFEKLVNTYEEVSEVITMFSDEEQESVAYINSFQYSRLLRNGKLVQDLTIQELNLKETASIFLSEDITELSFTIENLYNNMGLNNVPIEFLMKLKDLYDSFIDFNKSSFQMSKANVSFVNNCVKTTIHLPKTTYVNEKIETFSKSISKITTDELADIEVKEENVILYNSIVELLDIYNVNDLKIDVLDTDISVSLTQEESVKLEKKVSNYKELIKNTQNSDFVKYVIPYEINTYSNSFMALDEHLNHYTYYIAEDSLEELWVIKDKIINMNAKELEQSLKDENDITFKTFKKHFVSIEGKYRSKSSADVSKINYVIASEIQ